MESKLLKCIDVEITAWTNKACGLGAENYLKIGFWKLFEPVMKAGWIIRTESELGAPEKLDTKEFLPKTKLNKIE